MSLTSMIKDPSVSIEEIGFMLDEMTHTQRMTNVYNLPGKMQARLYRKAEAAMPLTLDFFVPRSQGPLSPVIHHGKNSLPMFRHFRKPFCMPQNDPNRLYGYNDLLINKVIGPGYFVAYTTEDYPTWRDRGAVVIDYFRTPQTRIPPVWPKVQPNGIGLQRHVYHQTRDFMRRISSHVSIGSAWRNERPMNSYFLLCREDEVERKAIASEASS